jgi:excisionase family DNA binding protein
MGLSERRRHLTHEVDIMTTFQAAEYLQMHPKTVAKLALQGAIPGQKVGSQWRFSREALHEWIEHREML